MRRKTIHKLKCLDIRVCNVIYTGSEKRTEETLMQGYKDGDVILKKDAINSLYVILMYLICI